jgi:hypothetical protein
MGVLENKKVFLYLRKEVKKFRINSHYKKSLSCLSINAFNPKQQDNKTAKFPLNGGILQLKNYIK